MKTGVRKRGFAQRKALFALRSDARSLLLTARLTAVRKMRQPVAVDLRRQRAPGSGDPLRHAGRRKIADRLSAAVRLRTVAEAVQHLLCFRIEIALRHARISIALGFQITADITPILAQQRVGFILRMALEKNEQAAA